MSVCDRHRQFHDLRSASDPGTWQASVFEKSKDRLPSRLLRSTAASGSAGPSLRASEGVVTRIPSCGRAQEGVARVSGRLESKGRRRSAKKPTQHMVSGRFPAIFFLHPPLVSHRLPSPSWTAPLAAAWQRPGEWSRRLGSPSIGLRKYLGTPGSGRAELPGPYRVDQARPTQTSPALTALIRDSVPRHIGDPAARVPPFRTHPLLAAHDIINASPFYEPSPRTPVLASAVSR
jgi:hypothetical protein